MSTSDVSYLNDGYGDNPYGDDSFGDPDGSTPPSTEYGQDGYGSSTYGLSHTTQELQNYFDHKDTRARDLPYSIDAQLLNTAAGGVDSLQLKVARENAAQTLATCPTELDNRGVYYAVPLDSSYSLNPTATSLPTVQGLRNGQWVTLSVYDDRTPLPARYLQDSERSAVYMPNPQLFDATAVNSGDVLI